MTDRLSRNSDNTGNTVKKVRKGRFIRRAAALLTAAAIAFSVSFAAMPVTAYAEGNEWTVYEYLTDVLGFNTAAACGIMANLDCESHFNPGAGSRGGGGSYGMVQWLGGRKSWMMSWCNKNGFSSGSIEGQLSFTYYELSTKYPDLLYTLNNVELSADGAYNAAYAFCMYYERPANTAGTSAYRASLASGTFWPRYSIYAIDQWLDYPEGKKYIRSGEFVTGMTEIDGVRYMFNKEGIMQTGFQKWDGKKYYFSKNGAMYTGWLDLKGNKYYLAPNGILKTGDFEVEGQKFTADEKGKVIAVGAINEVKDTTSEIAEKSVTQEEDPTINAESGLETDISTE